MTNQIEQRLRKSYASMRRTSNRQSATIPPPRRAQSASAGAMAQRMKAQGAQRAIAVGKRETVGGFLPRKSLEISASLLSAYQYSSDMPCPLTI